MQVLDIMGYYIVISYFSPNLNKTACACLWTGYHGLSSMELIRQSAMRIMMGWTYSVVGKTRNIDRILMGNILSRP